MNRKFSIQASIAHVTKLSSIPTLKDSGFELKVVSTFRTTEVHNFVSVNVFKSDWNPRLSTTSRAFDIYEFSQHESLVQASFLVLKIVRLAKTKADSPYSVTELRRCNL